MGSAFTPVGAGVLSFSPADEDRFVDEQRTAARLVGVDPEVAPRTVAELDAYFDKMSTRLAYTPDAKVVVKDLALDAKPSSFLKSMLNGEIIRPAATRNVRALRLSSPALGAMAVVGRRARDSVRRRKPSPL